jgi:hypothetical protein
MEIKILFLNRRDSIVRHGIPCKLDMGLIQEFRDLGTQELKEFYLFFNLF